MPQKEWFDCACIRPIKFPDRYFKLSSLIQKMEIHYYFLLKARFPSTSFTCMYYNWVKFDSIYR